MQQNIKFVLFGIIILFCIISSTKVTLAKNATEERCSPRAISDVISDAIQLKLIMLDIFHHLGMFEYDQREEWGWAGKDKINKTATDLLQKYKIDVTKVEYILPTELKSEVKGSDAIVYIHLTNNWTDLGSFSDYGELPLTKLRSGTISMSLKDLSINFSDNIECFVDEKVYVFRKGKWYQKN